MPSNRLLIVPRQIRFIFETDANFKFINVIEKPDQMLQSHLLVLFIFYV